MSRVTETEGRLLDAIKRLGALPEAGTPDEVEEWMLNHLQEVGRVPARDEKSFTSLEDKDEKGKQKGPLSTSVSNQTLRINTFSGDPEAKGETTFDLWRFEVKCLIRDGVYPKEVIRQAARKSLKGDAGRVVMRLGPEADLEQILSKLEVVYGVVDVGETLLAEFYAAKQGSVEDVATWGCRIEDLLDKAKQQNLLDTRDTRKMLRERFWTGLRADLKQTSRHKYDTVEDFDRLQVEIRKIEREFKVAELQAVDARVKEGVAKAATAGTDKGSEVNELKGMVHKLTNELQSMKLQWQQGNGQHGNQEVTTGQQTQQPRQHQQEGRRQQRGFNRMPPPQQQCPAPGQGPQQTGQYAYPRMSYARPPQHMLRYPGGYGAQNLPQQATNFGQQPQGPSCYNQQQQQPQSPPVQGCWRCGAGDHFKRDCPQPPSCWNCGDVNHLRHQCPHPPLNM